MVSALALQKKRSLVRFQVYMLFPCVLGFLQAVFFNSPTVQKHTELGKFATLNKTVV